MKGNLSLVFFTLLAQAGVGLAAAALVFGGDGGPYQAVRLCSLALVALGLAVAFSHLGRPFGAHRAACNLRSSWLSRECLFLGGFFVLGLAAPHLGRWSADRAWVLAGLAGLFSMASIYGRTAMPAWGMARTHIAFFTASAVLGTSFLLALAGLSAHPLTARPALLLVIGATLLQAADETLHLRAPRMVQAIGLACTLAGGIGFPVLVLATSGAWFYASVLFLAIGQGFLRYAYFARGVHAMAEGWANIAYRPGQRLTRRTRGAGSLAEDRR